MFIMWRKKVHPFLLENLACCKSRVFFGIFFSWYFIRVKFVTNCMSGWSSIREGLLPTQLPHLVLKTFAWQKKIYCECSAQKSSPFIQNHICWKPPSYSLFLHPASPQINKSSLMFSDILSVSNGNIKVLGDRIPALYCNNISQGTF